MDSTQTPIMPTATPAQLPFNLGLRGLSGILLLIVCLVFGSLAVFANSQTNIERSKNKAKRDPNLPPPTEIVSLRIYPIKSCRGIELPRAKLLRTGLDLDRHWMFVDASDRKFLTIRSDPSMTLINTQIDTLKDELTVKIGGTTDSITVPAHPTQEWLKEHCKLTKVEIWEAMTDGWEYNEEINSIFVRFFEKDVRLVYKGPEPRFAGGNGDESLYGEKVAHNFADVLSLQVASESSLQDLNRRLKEKDQDPLTIERFRPNIIVKGNEPWEEDNWKRVQISTLFHELEQLRKVQLDVVARCARCQVPNVNPDTAEKHAKEPWEVSLPVCTTAFTPCHFSLLVSPKCTAVLTLCNRP